MPDRTETWVLQSRYRRHSSAHVRAPGSTPFRCPDRALVISLQERARHLDQSRHVGARNDARCCSCAISAIGSSVLQRTGGRMTDDDLPMDEYRRAGLEITRGNPEVYKSLWSRRDDVTL